MPNKNQKKERNTELNTEPGDTKGAPEGHDGHGTPFKRVPGPGPKDAGKGAAGAEAIERIEGHRDEGEGLS
jgi:hypothetical protein